LRSFSLLIFKNMEIVKIHYKISKPVVSFKEIKSEAEEMCRFIVTGQFRGLYNKAFALAHCQVSETPMSFFIVSPDVVNEKMFEDNIIINPEIIDAPLHKNIAASNPSSDGKTLTIPNAIEYQEPCMSFPFRHPKRILRYDLIKVRYQIPGLFGLKTIERELSGVPSQIFQHEFDHTQGKNIFFESEAPVKWWELLGKGKSKGGTSLDPADSLGLERAKESEFSGDKLREYAKQ